MKKAIFLILLFNCLLTSIAQWGEAVNIETYNGTGGDAGYYNAICIANGNPAIAYFDNIKQSLLFKRSNDVNGSTWAQPVIIDEILRTGKNVSLTIVNGNPAVIYYDDANGNILYKRALDQNGAIWPPSTVIGQTGASTSSACISLQLINGKPAASYSNDLNDDLMFVSSQDPNGNIWNTPVVIDAAGITGSQSSLHEVNGRPAIAYYDQTNSSLRYVRSDDADGISWTNYLTLDLTGIVGQRPSMTIIDGNPAISYRDGTAMDVKYIRALDVDGNTWGTPLYLDGSGNIGNFTSLIVVNGNPAIAYYNQPVALKYIRANDPQGLSWGTPMNVDNTTDVGVDCSMIIVNGFPAISYYDVTNKNLKYVRATNINGSSWGTKLSFDISGASGEHGSLQKVNGKLAASYYDSTNDDLRFVISYDSTGNYWSEPVIVDAAGNVGQFTSLEVVDGFPAISYLDVGNNFLKFVRALDSNGTVWGTPIILDNSYTAGKYSSLEIVDGFPAIAYYKDDFSNSQLKYIRALDTQGNSWGTAINPLSTFLNGKNCDLKIINGYPAIAYYDDGLNSMCYVRASDAIGSAWNTPITLLLCPGVNFWCSMQVVNGNPAIGFYYESAQEPYFIRANDVNGTSWGTAISTNTFCNTGQYISMAVVGGLPAISYYSPCDSRLEYIQALNANGTSWGPPQTVYGNINFDTGKFTSLIEVSPGVPGILSYCVSKMSPLYSATNLCSATYNSINVNACGPFTSPSNLYTWSTSGTYIDVIPNVAGCDSIISINLTITPNNLSVSQLYEMLSAIETGAIYQWLDCENSYSQLTGYNSQNFSAPTTGIFAVEITKSGCVDTSACFPINQIDFYSNPAYAPLNGDVFALPVSHIDSCDANVFAFIDGGISPYSFDWFTQTNNTYTSNGTQYCQGVHTLKVTDNIGDSLLLDYYIAEVNNYYSWYNPTLATDTIYLIDMNCLFDFSQSADSVLITNQYVIGSAPGPGDSVLTEITYYQNGSGFVLQDTSIFDITSINLYYLNVFCPSKSLSEITSIMFNDDYSIFLSMSIEPHAALTLFPNPTHGIFKLKNLPENATIELRNALGEILFVQSMLPGNFEYDMNGFADGIYLVKISTETEAATYKLIKN